MHSWPLPSASPAGVSVLWDLSWSSHSKHLTQTASLGPSFQQLSWWNAWHGHAQSCPCAKINIWYVLLGFLELTPKYLFTQTLTFSWVMGKAPRTRCWWQSRIQNPTQNFRVGQGLGDRQIQTSHFRIRKMGLQAVNQIQHQNSGTLAPSLVPSDSLKGMNTLGWNGPWSLSY